jgi:hypothetical protein
MKAKCYKNMSAEMKFSAVKGKSIVVEPKKRPPLAGADDFPVLAQQQAG